MSDTITAKGSDSKFKPHPEGQFVGQCVDTIDLGDNVETFIGKPTKLSHKCAIVFRTGEKNEQTGDYIDIAREFTVSMGDLANLRKFLEQWRGKPYTPEQIEEGVPLHKLTGNHGLLTVAHKLSGQGPDLRQHHGVRRHPEADGEQRREVRGLRSRRLLGRKEEGLRRGGAEVPRGERTNDARRRGRLRG
jgi:hypothetical protein